MTGVREPVRLTRHPYLRHLRLGFNLLLSPIFLWGALLAGGGMDTWGFWFGFLSLHIFLYGGTTAFNSYFDRDEGPVGGMMHPPAVDTGLLYFSLLVQALGLPLAVSTGNHFLLGWLLLFMVFTAYSHPAVRLKARPVAAMAAITLGQGSLGFALGWLAVADGEMLFGPTGVMGMAIAALVVAGLYLVTQSYQVAEDARRGDVTLAVLLGAARSLQVALVPLSAGGGLLIALVVAHFSVWQGVALAGFFLVLGLWLLLRSLTFEESQVLANFRFAMRFTTSASLGLSLFLLYRLIT